MEHFRSRRRLSASRFWLCPVCLWFGNGGNSCEGVGVMIAVLFMSCVFVSFGVCANMFGLVCLFAGTIPGE